MSKNKKGKGGFKNIKADTFNKKKLKNSIITILYGESGKTVNYKQISTWLGIKDLETRKLVNVVLQELHDDGYLDKLFVVNIN
jgi:ribonuclease R